MALKLQHEAGGLNGYEMGKKWRSFAPTKVNIETVFYLAQESGWVNTMSNQATGNNKTTQQPAQNTPLTEEEQEEYNKLKSAVMAIQLGDMSKDNRHDASKVIGYAICHKYYLNHRDIGGYLCLEWDKKTGGYSVSVYCTGNPKHPSPVTVNSIFAMAKANGWTPPPAPWPELQELITKVTPVPYPIDALPDLVGNAVKEVAGFVQSPISLLVQSALSAISLAIQGHYDIARDNNLSGPCGLYMLAIAESGERKTTGDEYFMRAIKDYEKREREKAQPLIDAYETELKILESQRRGLQSAIEKATPTGKGLDELKENMRALNENKLKAPKVPKLITEDATPEGLGNHLVPPSRAFSFRSKYGPH